MSAKGNKAKATKNPKGEASQDPAPSVPRRQPSGGRLPARSLIDDGMRSQMFNLSPALRRRSGSSLLPGLADPSPKKRKAKVSVDKEPPLLTKSGPSDLPLGIRLEEAVEESHQQSRNNGTPDKEHSAIESTKGPGNVEGNGSFLP